MCETGSTTPPSTLLKTWMHTWKSDHFHISSQKWFSYTNFEQMVKYGDYGYRCILLLSLWTCLNTIQNNKQAIWKCPLLSYESFVHHNVTRWDKKQPPNQLQNIFKEDCITTTNFSHLFYMNVWRSLSFSSSNYVHLSL